MDKVLGFPSHHLNCKLVEERAANNHHLLLRSLELLGLEVINNLLLSCNNSNSLCSLNLSSMLCSNSSSLE